MSEEDRIPNDPKYWAAALLINEDAGETGEPMSWRIQEDGTLTVITTTGKEINRPLPLPTAQGLPAVTSQTARPEAPAPSPHLPSTAGAGKATSLKQPAARKVPASAGKKK